MAWDEYEQKKKQLTDANVNLLSKGGHKSTTQAANVLDQPMLLRLLTDDGSTPANQAGAAQCSADVSKSPATAATTPKKRRYNRRKPVPVKSVRAIDDGKWKDIDRIKEAVLENAVNKLTGTNWHS